MHVYVFFHFIYIFVFCSKREMGGGLSVAPLLQNRPLADARCQRFNKLIQPIALCISLTFPSLLCRLKPNKNSATH